MECIVPAKANITWTVGTSSNALIKSSSSTAPALAPSFPRQPDAITGQC